MTKKLSALVVLNCRTYDVDRIFNAVVRKPFGKPVEPFPRPNSVAMGRLHTDPRLCRPCYCTGEGEKIPRIRSQLLSSKVKYLTYVVRQIFWKEPIS